MHDGVSKHFKAARALQQPQGVLGLQKDVRRPTASCHICARALHLFFM